MTFVARLSRAPGTFFFLTAALSFGLKSVEQQVRLPHRQTAAASRLLSSVAFQDLSPSSAMQAMTCRTPRRSPPSHATDLSPSYMPNFFPRLGNASFPKLPYGKPDLKALKEMATKLAMKAS